MDQYTAILPQEIYFVASGLHRARHHAARAPCATRSRPSTKPSTRKGSIPTSATASRGTRRSIVIDALRHVGTNASAKQVLDYISSSSISPATDGYYDFTDGSQRGIGLDAVVVCRWDPAKKTWVAASEPGGKPLKVGA